MIRKVNATDLAECVEVIRDSFSTVADAFGLTVENASRFTAFSTTPERLQYHFCEEHRPMYAYYDDGRMVGYYSLFLQDDECELNNLCVLPAYRHRKIGEKLLNSAFETATKLQCRNMKIGIIEENKVLREWYEEFGFVHISTQQFDFFPFTCGYMVKQL